MHNIGSESVVGLRFIFLFLSSAKCFEKMEQG